MRAAPRSGLLRCPRPPKRLGEGDFTKIPNGMPGIEDRMRLIFHGAAQGRLSWNRFVEVTATAPSKIMGLFPQKGTLAPGSDADVVIWDPSGSHVMSVESSHSDVDYNAYEGLEVEGDIELVMARGRVLIEGGEYHGSKGDGRFLKRGGNGLLR